MQKILRNGFLTVFSTFTKMEWNFHISAVTNFTTKIRICTLNWMYLEWNVKRKKVVLERWAWYIYNYPAAVKSKFASADHLHCWSVVQLCWIRNVQKAMTAFTITRVEPVLEVGWILCVRRLLVDSNKQKPLAELPHWDMFVGVELVRFPDPLGKWHSWQSGNQTRVELAWFDMNFNGILKGIVYWRISREFQRDPGTSQGIV